MGWTEDNLNRAPTPSVIIHLGAGGCTELEHYIASGARHIVLFEPNPDLLPELRRQSESHSHIDIMPVAVSGEAGRRALKLYNYADLASLRRPTGLLELLPGLQQIDQVLVDVMAAHTVPRELGLDADANNWLIIDTPGEEGAITSALDQHCQLHYFERIIVRAGAESFYDGALPAEQLTRQLEQLGYYVEGVQDTSDRDWPRYHLRLNPKAIECRRLKSENEGLFEQKETLEQKNRELLGQVDELSTRLQQLAEEKSVLEQQNERLDQQKNESQRRIEELESALRQAEQQKKDLTVQNESLRTNLEELEAAHKQSEQRQGELADQGTKLKSQLNELEAAKRELTQQEKEQRAKLQAEVEKLKKSLLDMTTAKEHYEKLANEQAGDLENQQKQQTELDERQRSLDTEIQRAEAQLDLVKDVLIREKNF